MRKGRRRAVGRVRRASDKASGTDELAAAEVELAAAKVELADAEVELAATATPARPRKATDIANAASVHSFCTEYSILLVHTST